MFVLATETVNYSYNPNMHIDVYRSPYYTEFYVTRSFFLVFPRHPIYDPYNNFYHEIFSYN